MKVFIVEDEIPAQVNLKRALKANFSDNADYRAFDFEITNITV